MDKLKLEQSTKGKIIKYLTTVTKKKEDLMKPMLIPASYLPEEKGHTAKLNNDLFIHK